MNQQGLQRMTPEIPTQSAQKSRRAFVLIDLLFVAVILTVLIALHLPNYSRLRERTHLTIDQNNLRQILRGSALYNNDNNGQMAHPTWGGNLSGPDGWAYITENNGRIPDAPNYPPHCAGRDINSIEFTNQVKFFRRGQVTQYLPGVKTTWCPKDVATRGSGTLRRNWIGRPQKVTSYAWSATAAGLVGRFGVPPPIGQTYKVSDFLPTDWLTWEASDIDPFNFNDAGVNPAGIAAEVISLRHSGLKRYWIFPSGLRGNLPGVAPVGTFGGNVDLVRFPLLFDLLHQRVPSPNHLLNGPRYRR